VPCGHGQVVGFRAPQAAASLFFGPATMGGSTDGFRSPAHPPPTDMTRGRLSQPPTRPAGGQADRPGHPVSLCITIQLHHCSDALGVVWRRHVTGLGRCFA
jgi:hypothetical protein